MKSTAVLIVVLTCFAGVTGVAQETARGAWHATNNDCFIQTFVLADRGVASVSYSNGTEEKSTRWRWGSEGLTIVSEKRGVLLMDGHDEDMFLVAEVDYSATDDIDFRPCRFER